MGALLRLPRMSSRRGECFGKRWIAGVLARVGSRTGSANMIGLVWVRAHFKQQPHQRDIVIMGRDDEGRFPIAVGQIDTRAIFEQ